MSQVTATYSFDAPTDFINFLSLDAEQETENVDLWFDEKANLENRFLGRNGIGEPFQGKASLRTATLQQGSGTPLKADLLPSRSATKMNRDPQTPVLQTKYRARPVTCKSAAEQEAEELEKLQQR